MTLVPLPTLVFPIPFPLFWREQIDHPEKLESIRFSLPHPFDSTAHAKSAPMFRLPTIVSIAANRWWENHIAGACPPKYNPFSTRTECRSGFFSDLQADVRVPVWVWEEGVQSQPIVRLSAHVSYSYFHFTLADHVFEIACSHKQFFKFLYIYILPYILLINIKKNISYSLIILQSRLWRRKLGSALK